eukprot:397536-Alexandrium_andersonii.AAC.1
MLQRPGGPRRASPVQAMSAPRVLRVPAQLLHQWYCAHMYAPASAPCAATHAHEPTCSFAAAQ